MSISHILPRRLLQATAVAALPGVLWVSFEMFGLTLIYGSQMLFFSIMHGWLMSIPITLLVIGVPAALLLLLKCLIALLWHQYRCLLGVKSSSLAVVACALLIQGALLASYCFWSDSALRIPICLGGALLTATLFMFVVRDMFARVSTTTKVLQ